MAVVSSCREVCGLVHIKNERNSILILAAFDRNYKISTYYKLASCDGLRKDRMKSSPYGPYMLGYKCATKR